MKETDDNLQGPAIVLQSSCEKMNDGNRHNVPKDNQDTNIYNICKYCNKSFTRSDNLAKHVKFCYARDTMLDKMQQKIKQLEHDYKNKSDESKHRLEQSKHFQKEMEHYKKLLFEAGQLVKTSVNSLTYVIDNYDDAPVIKQIKFDEINTKKVDSFKFIEEVLLSYREKTLDKYLGDAIILIYKKKNPEDQSIWNTDTTRLTYLLKEMLGDKKSKTSNWIVDKKGSRTIEYVITPILSNLKELLFDYNAYVSHTTKVKAGSVEFDIALENSKATVKLANEIETGVTAKAILRYISPRLQLNNKKNIEKQTKIKKIN